MERFGAVWAFWVGVQGPMVAYHPLWHLKAPDLPHLSQMGGDLGRHPTMATAHDAPSGEPNPACTPNFEWLFGRRGGEPKPRRNLRCSGL